MNLEAQPIEVIIFVSWLSPKSQVAAAYVPGDDQNAKLAAYKARLCLGAGRFASWLPILAVEALN